MKLFCVLVGEAGSAFPVKIDDDDTVGELKEVVKKKNEDVIKCNARELTLFIAKRDDKWMSTGDAEVLTAEELLSFPEMNPSFRLDNDAYCGKNFVPNEGENHILVKVPKSGSASSPSEIWVVDGSVENALSAKGVRNRLFRLAALYIGYYDPDCHANDKDVAFWYEDKTLRIHVLFKTEENAFRFDNALRDEFVTLNSPLNGQTITTEINTVASPVCQLRHIYYTDYIAHETDSPQQTMSSISSSVSIIDTRTDEFNYQRIEELWVFGPYGKAESCHLMPKHHCRKHESYTKYDDDQSNRLALSRDMHGFYDGLNCDIPIVNMYVGSSSPDPSFDDRYRVEVFVQVLDSSVKDLIFNRLKEGSTATDNPLVMKTFVYVENSKIFKQCMTWKFKKIQKQWKDFYDMTPAAD